MRAYFFLVMVTGCSSSVISAAQDGAVDGPGSPPDASDGLGPPRDGAPGDGTAPDAWAGDGPIPFTVVADRTGIQRLERDGANLFEGVGGYYIIGSCTGADDANNVTSQGSDGNTLRAPGNCPGAPFSLVITGSNPFHVAISIGPLPVDYRTLSVPLDPRREYIDSFAFSGTSYQVGCANSWSPRSGSGAAFDTVPQPCTIPGVGAVGVARVTPAPQWGEITGPLGTIRRTILTGDATELDFYRHPGTHNIEIGFSSNVSTVIPSGTVIHLEEEILITGPTVLPPTTIHQVEWPQFGHQVGRPEADGWSADTNLDPAGFLCYGPYVSLSPGAFVADFRLLIDNRDADNLQVARIDVNDYDSGQMLASRDILRMDFLAANTYQDFTLAFVSPAQGHRLELRTYWRDRAYIRQDRVTLHWPR